MLFWLFNQNVIWFCIALSIALTFDIFPVINSDIPILYHNIFFLFCLSYIFKKRIRFKTDFILDKDAVYGVALVLFPFVVYVINGSGIGFILYITYFLILILMVNLILNYRYDCLKFLEWIPITLSVIIATYTFLEIYSFRTAIAVYSSVYDLDGIRNFGGHYGRALGPSREPSHLILIQIVATILSIKLHNKKTFVLILLLWFLISQFTFSRSIFLVWSLLATWGMYTRSSALRWKIIAFFTVPLSLIVLLSISGISDRFSTGFSFFADASTIQRYGTLYILLKEYLLSFTQPIVMLSSALEICTAPQNKVDDLSCKMLAPALGFSSYLVGSMPAFLFVFFAFHKRVRYLMVPLLLSGLVYFVTVTPAIVSMLFLWKARKLDEQ